MAISSAPREYRTLIPVASLIAGPLLMAIGDLLHPEERMAPAEQIAILVDHASRWYTAHLLLFVGMMLFIPGLLALAALTGARKPAVGYAARILVLMGTAAVASIFVSEMLLGRFVLDGVDPAAATDLLESTGSGVGRAAAVILIGVLFILAEIFSAQVLLSQIGNILVFCGSAAAAWLILQGATGESADLT